MKALPAVFTANFYEVSFLMRMDWQFDGNHDGEKAGQILAAHAFSSQCRFI